MLRLTIALLLLAPALAALVLVLALDGEQRSAPPRTATAVAGGIVNVQATIELPSGYPLRYVNLDLDAERIGRDGLPAIRRISVGAIDVPGLLAGRAVRWALGQWSELGDERVALAIVRALQSYPERLELACAWPRAPVEHVRIRAVSGGGRNWSGTYGDRIAAWAGAESGPRAPLLGLLRTLVGEAAARTAAGADPVAENRTAIMVAAAHAFGCTRVAGGRPVRHVKPALHGRDDLGRHFVASAVLAALLDREVSDSVGLDKEVSDSRHVTGFSFSDLAANRAGARFGDLATASVRSARRVQDWMEQAESDTDIMPDVRDLPDHLPEEVLKRRFGEPGEGAYQRILEEIEARIAYVPLYRESK